MKIYRVLRKSYLGKVKFIPEKRFLGFLWWRKFLDIEFDSYDKAVEAICHDANDPEYDVVAEISFGRHDLLGIYE